MWRTRDPVVVSSLRSPLGRAGSRFNRSARRMPRGRRRVRRTVHSRANAGRRRVCDPCPIGSARLVTTSVRVVSAADIRRRAGRTAQRDRWPVSAGKRRRDGRRGSACRRGGGAPGGGGGGGGGGAGGVGRR